MLAGFDYSAHCVLVFELDEVAAQFSERDLDANLLSLVSCWDAALILTGSRVHESALQVLVQSQLAPRIAVSQTHMLGTLRSAIWAVQLNRLVASSHLHPRSLRALTDPSLQEKIASLPPGWRAFVHQAIARPHDWNGERLALECCTTMRTLQRHLRAAGLPSPKNMLRAPTSDSSVSDPNNDRRKTLNASAPDADSSASKMR